MSGTVRAERALHRQRIMEIKAERLANGTIMAPDCAGQLGHANEAAEEESIHRDEVLAGDSTISDTCVHVHTQTHRVRLIHIRPCSLSVMSAGWIWLASTLTGEPGPDLVQSGSRGSFKSPFIPPQPQNEQTSLYTINKRCCQDGQALRQRLDSLSSLFSDSLWTI